MGEFRKDPNLAIERTVSLHEGEDSRSVPYLLSENQAAVLENLIINQVGRREMRRGAAAFGGLYEDPGGLFGYFQESLEQIMVGVWGSHLYESTGNGGWTRIAGASSVSLVSGKLHMGVPGRSIDGRALFICQAERSVSGSQDQSELQVYNIDTDTGTAYSGYAPRCVEFFQNRVWIGGNRVTSDTNGAQDVYWGELGNFGISESNQLLIEPGVGGEVTALVQTREETPRLIVFKDEAIAVLDPRWGSSSALIPSAADAIDTVNSSVKLITRGTGCVATKTAIWVPGGEEGADVFFLASDGVRSLKRAENDTTAGAGLPLSWNAKRIFDRINWAVAHKSVARVYDNAYHIALPLDGATQLTHVARYELGAGNTEKAWSLLDWAPKDLDIFQLGDQTRLFMQYNERAGDTSATNADTSTTLPHQIYQAYSGGLDPGASNILAKELSKQYILGEPLKRKRWNTFTMTITSADTQIVEIGYKVDSGPLTTLATETIVGSSGSVILGETALPWQDAAELIRRKQYSLKDIPTGYGLQMQISTVSGETAVGRYTVFLSEVSAHVLQDSFESDD